MDTNWSNVDWATWIAVAVVGVLSVARTARLLTHDDFPPTAALRGAWVRRTGDKWGPLFLCPFCITPYLAAGMIFWAWVSDLHWTWWLINGWWAASYLAAIVVAHDEPPE